MSHKVLVLDDSEMVLEATQLALEDAGFEVTAISSPALFPTTLNRQRPDLVLLDVAMPIMGGHSLVELAKKSHLHRCPILLYSDRSAEQLKSLAESCGADGYVRKSSDPNQLLQQIRVYLPERAARPTVETSNEIFLVDDQEVVRTLLAEYLRRGSGCDPVLLESAEECLERAKKKPPAMIVMDLQLGGMAGDEACRALRSDPITREVPVVIMTGRAHASVVMKCWEVGADDFIPKPIQPDQLEAKIRAVRQGRTAPTLVEGKEYPRILLASADPFHQSHLGLHLEWGGHRVRRAGTLAEVGAAIDSSAEAFEAAICDVRMFMDGGRDVLHRLRARPNARLLLMTPQEFPPEQRAIFDGWSAESTSVMPGPHTPDLVLTRLNTLLKRTVGDLRLAERAPFYAVAEFRTSPTSPWSSGFAHDLSPSGLFIRTLTPAAKGTAVQFRVGEWPLNDPIEGLAQVAWSNEYGPRTTYSYPVGMGLQFGVLEPKFQARLREAYDAGRRSAGPAAKP